MSNPPARCLDVTRLISRLGRGPLTGVDRVELAYLRHLAAAPAPLFLLARTALGYILCDGPDAVLRRLEGSEDWGRADLIGRLTRRAHPLKRRAEADLRRLAAARCGKRGLARMLAARLPPGTVYFSTGHSNLSRRTLAAWRAVPGATVAVLIHDTIPLDFPQFQRPGTVDSFRARLENVSAHADMVIYNSRATRADAERWLAGIGRVPPALVAHLGVDLAVPGDPAAPEPPYFVTVGTIEPRKNHALLLDVWDDLGDAAPHLVIAGQRGWANAEVFARLDACAGDRILERAGLDDAALAGLVKGSAALLFPSRAEGYGLPPIEAAGLQVPVICADLPVYREVLGDIPVYLSPDDVYSWRDTITRLVAEHQTGQRQHPAPFQVPRWEDHFNQVLKVM